MASAIILFSACIILAISFLHMYWALGGRWGIHAAVPIKSDGTTPLFTPGVLATWVVAAILFVLSFVLLTQSGHMSYFQANWMTKITCLLFALIFFVRAIGDFRHIGFFKKVKGSVFARNDTWLYSPLCLFLSLSFAIAFTSQ